MSDETEQVVCTHSNAGFICEKPALKEQVRALQAELETTRGDVAKYFGWWKSAETELRNIYRRGDDLNRRISDLRQYESFACKILEASTQNTGSCGTLDGRHIRDIAIAHGFIAVKEMTVPCGDVCSCFEYATKGEVVSCERHTWKALND